MQAFAVRGYQVENLTKKERRALRRKEKEEKRTANLTDKKRKKIIGWSMIGGSVVFIIFIIIWLTANKGGELTFELDDQNPYKGNKDSSVVIREFSDFQCSACRVAYFNIKNFMEEYKDKVKFIYYDFPLKSIHKNATRAAEAARCAEMQGDFWGYHDMLFERQKGWEDLQNPNEIFISYANELGFDGAAFGLCLTEGRRREIVEDNYKKSYNLGLNSTPTIFINDKKFTGVMSVESLKEKVDLLLESETE